MSLTGFITPTNLQEEKEKFFSSNTYHPVFEYEWTKPEGSIPQKFSKLVNAIKDQKHEDIVVFASEVFEAQIENELIDILISEIVIPTPLKQEFNQRQIESAFEGAFSMLGLDEYSIQFTHAPGFNFRPSYADKTIYASKHMNLEFFSVDGEVKHELTHIIRHENGKYNNVVNSHNYLPTEEGLACYMHDIYGYRGDASYHQHACEYLVTDTALKGSLRNVVDHLMELGFSKELAWQRGARHKFGFVQTKEPGDIMKPSMYYYHSLKVKNLTDLERLRLFVGKISLQDISQYPTYSGRIDEDLLKRFYLEQF